MESVAQLRHVDVRFNPANLLTMNVSLPPVRYNTDQKTASFFRDLAGRVGSLPGVRAAAAAWYLPMQGSAGTPVQDAAKPPLPLAPITYCSWHRRIRHLLHSTGTHFTSR